MRISNFLKCLSTAHDNLLRVQTSVIKSLWLDLHLRPPLLVVSEMVSTSSLSCQLFAVKKKPVKFKPMTAIKAMIKMNCHRCLCHPVCCKYLKAKWMDFGWKVYLSSILIYVVFLISLNAYVFGIPTYQESLENKGKIV